MVFAGEQVEGGDNVGEIRDKFAIKVRKPEERANALDGGGRFPFFDGRELDRVHLDSPLANDHAKKFDARNVKGTLGDLEGQSMFTKTK